jgi:hypothetical protein
MGKASSSKKVARAARAGGRSSGTRQRNLLFPGAIAAIVIAGSGLIAWAANDRKTDTSVEPMIGEHWHAAVGVDICGEFQAPTPEFESPVGIHTHGDGVIHIHPFADGGAGENATLGVFLEGAGIELTDDSLTIGEETWTEGEQDCDGEDAELVVGQWADVSDEESNPARITEDFGDLRFRNDGEGYTIAFLPEGDDPARPETASNLQELGAVDSGEVTTTTAGDGASTTGTDVDTTGTGGETPTTGGEPTDEGSTDADTTGDTTATTGG